MHAEEPELRDLLYELARQDPLLEPLADVGDDARTHELPHGVADRTLLVVEERVEREEVARVERRLLRRRRHRRQWYSRACVAQLRPFAALLKPGAELRALKRLEAARLRRMKGRFQLDNLLLFGVAALAAETYLPFQ